MMQPYQPKPADAFQQTMGGPQMGGFPKQMPNAFHTFMNNFGGPLPGYQQAMGQNHGPQVMQPEVSPMPPGYQPPGLLNAPGPHAQGGQFAGFGGGRGGGGFAPQGAQMAGQFGGGLFGGAFRNGGPGQSQFQPFDYRRGV